MRRLLLALLLTTGATAPVVAASAQERETRKLGVRVLEVPSHQADDPRAQRYLVDRVAPGAIVRRRIEVRNDGTERLTARLYAGGAVISGTTFSPAPDEAETDIARWTKLDRSRVELPPGAAVPVVVTIDVPTDATGGERYGAVWAELPPRDAVGGAGVVNRVGIRIYLAVGGDEAARTDFVVDTLTARRDADRRPVVLARVRNTGERAIDLTGTLRLSDGPGGTTAGPFPAEVGTTLAPGRQAPVRVPLDPALPAGPWSARITLRSGELERTVEARLTFPDAAGTSAAPVEAREVTGTLRGRIVLGAALGLLALLVVTLLLYLLRRGRLRKQEAEASRG